MSTQDLFDRTLVSLSEAALDDSKLVSAAAMIADLTRATGHSIAWGDPATMDVPEVFFARFFAGTERREDWERAYFGDCWGRDECILRLLGLQDGQFALIRDLYTDEEKKASPVYNEFRRATRSQDGLFMVLDGSEGCRVLWSIADSAEPGGWSSDQIEIIERLAPHIRQFARVRRVLADAGALGASLTELLDNTRSGVIHLSRRGGILAANDRAREVLVKGDGLSDRGGMLTAGTRDETVELQRLLARALAPYGVQGEGGSMTITRRGSPTPLVVEVHPIGADDTDHRAWGRGCDPTHHGPAEQAPDRSGGVVNDPGAVGNGDSRCPRRGGRRDRRSSRTGAGLRGEHRADSPEAHLPQAGNQQTSRTRREDSVAGWPPGLLPLAAIPCRDSSGHVPVWLERGRGKPVSPILGTPPA